MEDRVGQFNIGAIFRAWLDEKARQPELKVEDFIVRQYMMAHSTKDIQSFQTHMKHWREQDSVAREFFEKKGVPNSGGRVFPWQCAEMLDSVISEADMLPDESVRFLANVRLMLGYRLSRLLDSRAAATLTRALEARYENEWEMSRRGVSEQIVQALFAETVSLMCYAGVHYDDETREILAGIGLGFDVDSNMAFRRLDTGMTEADLRFLSIFLVSEIFLSQHGRTAVSSAAIDLFLDHVIPICVCASSASWAPCGAAFLLPLYLGQLFKEKDAELLQEVSMVQSASQAVLSIETMNPLPEQPIMPDLIWEQCGTPLNLSVEQEFYETLLRVVPCQEELALTEAENLVEVPDLENFAMVDAAEQGAEEPAKEERKLENAE